MTGPKIAELPHSLLLWSKPSLPHIRSVCEDDWRLDSEKSIRGGLVYLDYLIEYWRNPAAEELLRKFFQRSRCPHTGCSGDYNAGPTRVKSALEKLGKNYLKDAALFQARKYVSLIESFCFHFSNTLPSNDDV